MVRVRTTRKVRGAKMLGLMLCGVLLGACMDATGTRAGGEPPPITLRVGTDDPQGRPASNQIEQFAREVHERSGGDLRIAPVFHAVGVGQSEWDQKVARRVVTGGLDMGLIPARAWDTEGVTTLRPLNAPFLVDSDQRLKAVVSDDDLSKDLMSGLTRTGVVGLALYPEGLRHLFVFDTDHISPSSLAGARVRSPKSHTTWAIFEALGAEPTDDRVGDAIDAVESEFALAATFPEASAVVGNLTLFPKVNSLVVNSDRFAELEPAHQQILREAALATREWAVDVLPQDAELAAAYCDAGGTVVLADEAELGRLRAAVRPVTDMLREDPETAALLHRISTMVRPLPAGRPVAGCAR